MSISGAACILCHNAGTTATTVPATEHADTLIDTANVGYTDEKAKGSAFTTCSTASCHGSSSPIWGVNTPNNTCTKCHGTGTVSVTAANRYVVAPPTNVAGNPGMLTGVGQVSNDAKVGAHQTHLQLFNGMTGTNVADYDQRCSFCHGTLPVSGNHANGSSTPVFSGLSTTAGMNGAAFVGGTTCNNIYCHNPAGTNGTNGTLNLVNAGTGTAPVWTNAAYLGDIRKTQANCGVCHKSPGDGGFTSSTTHGFTITQSCTGCHEHDGDLNGTVGRRHMDGVLYGGGNCDSCHGYGPTASDGKAERAVEGKGVHEKHVPHLVARWGGALNPAADQFGAGASWTNVCGVCHNGAIHSTGEAIGGTGRTISIPGAYQFGANPPVYKGTIGVSSATTPKTCSNVSCHFRETPVWSAL
jgi:predicted CxxxxCH...CXXCH cytochrome family protein